MIALARVVRPLCFAVSLVALGGCCGGKSSSTSESSSSKSSAKSASKRGNWDFDDKLAFMHSHCSGPIESAQKAKGTFGKPGADQYVSDVCASCFNAQVEAAYENPADAGAHASDVSQIMTSCMGKVNAKKK